MLFNLSRPSSNLSEVILIFYYLTQIWMVARELVQRAPYQSAAG